MSISNLALASSNLSNPSKGSSKPISQNSNYIGIVTRIVGTKTIIKIPKLNALQEFGPCDVYGTFPAVGDNVLCSYIDNRLDHIVVIGALASTDKHRDLQVSIFMEVI